MPAQGISEQLWDPNSDVSAQENDYEIGCCVSAPRPVSSGSFAEPESVNIIEGCRRSGALEATHITGAFQCFASTARSYGDASTCFSKPQPGHVSEAAATTRLRKTKCSSKSDKSLLRINGSHEWKVWKALGARSADPLRSALVHRRGSS